MKRELLRQEYLALGGNPEKFDSFFEVWAAFFDIATKGNGWILCNAITRRTVFVIDATTGKAREATPADSIRCGIDAMKRQPSLDGGTCFQLLSVA